MLFPEEDAPLLKAWVVKRIENTSDADSEVLAEYIIALLKHDGDKKSIRELCEKEIPDFLNEDATTFLDDMFQAIAYRSYLPGAPPPPPPKHAAPSAAQPSTSVHAPDALQDPRIPTGPRKRGYHDLDAPGGQDGYHGGQRPTKNARRSMNGQSRGGADQGRRGDHQPQAAGRFPPFDPQNPNPVPMEAFMPPGMPMPGMPSHLPTPVGVRGGRQRRNRRCRDFDTKGFCSRGVACPYEHGREAAPFIPPGIQQHGEEYNPEGPILTLQAMQNFMSQFPMNFMNADSGRGRNNRRGGRSGKRGGARAPFSAEGPVVDRSKSTIVVESIPEENFSEEEVKGFFTQFGNILEVTLQPYKRLAIVKFDAWAAANAAYKSHKAIFDNRFVKVYWYKDDQDAPKQAGVNGNRDGDDEANADAMETEADADAEPEMDPEEFRRRQEEAQQKFMEQEKKKAEIQRQREELEQQQKELLDKHRQAMELLKSKLAEKNGGTGDSAAPPTSAEALRAKLADLESEAKMLGIDPDETDMMPASPFPPGRGGHYGYRGRGGFPPRGRGSRGAARGRFGGTDGRHAAYAQYSLDNRPKRLAITGVDFSVPEKDEGLRHFLLGVGEFEAVEPSSTTTYVSFQDRKTAEKFQLLLNGKELPGIEGTLDVQWATGQPASASTSTKPQSHPQPSSAADAAPKKGREEDEQDDDEGGNDGTTRPARQVQEQEQAEMDYERPEEDDDAY